MPFNDVSWQQMMDWNDWEGLWMWFMMLGFYALAVLIIVLAVKATVHPSGDASRAPKEKEAEHILEERFARGEIDPEEFERRRDTLRRAA